jgi:hypothetical protein
MPAVTTAAATTTVSEKKLAANRLNAQKSTGPRTPAGKRSASQNALRHGGFAAATCLPHEDPAAFYHFRRAFVADLCPMTAPELFLADRAVSLAWRLQRLQQADAALYDAAQLNVERQLERAKNDLAKQDQQDNDNDDDNAHFTWIDNDNDTPAAKPPLHPDVRALLEDPSGTPPINPAFLLAASFERDQTHSPFDRLARAEQRLHAMYHRTLKDLTALQSRREKQSTDPNHHPKPCPFLPKEEPPFTDDQTDTVTDDTTPIAQNEPTADTDGNKSIAQNQPTAVEDPLPATPPAPQSLASSRFSNAQNKPTAPQPHDDSPPAKC